MPEVELPARPALVVIPDVEILEVGTWATSTGVFTFTPEDLASAVAAMDDPAIRSPVLKLGHRGKLSGGMPAFGRLDNLRTTNEGNTLVADLVGVPSWVADVMPYAWPSRSIEGDWNVENAQGGRQHRFRLTALSLLGIELPAVDTLEDVRAVLTAESMEQAGATLTVEAQKERNMPNRSTQVAASITTEDIRRAYYDQLGPAQQWWWIRELSIDPLELIVDDDEGGLWRVPVTIDDGEVAFGEPQAVRVEYVAAAEPGPVADTRRTVTFASRRESRGDPVELSTLRKRLGLPDTASDDDVIRAATERITEAEDTNDQDDAGSGQGGDAGTSSGDAGDTGTGSTGASDTGQGATLPEGTVLVDAQQLAQLQAQAAQGVQAMTTIRQRDRDAFISRQVAAGRLAPSNKGLRATLEREWERDPAEAERIAAELAVVVPTVALGHAGGSDGSTDDSAFDAAIVQHFPELAEIRGGDQSGNSGR